MKSILSRCTTIFAYTPFKKNSACKSAFELKDISTFESFTTALFKDKFLNS